MDVPERIREAVLPIVPVCVPGIYQGDEQVYCTFNDSRSPEEVGDNRVTLIAHQVQLHYFLPWPDDPRRTIKALCRAVEEAGFTYPEVADASDVDGQHYALEFEDVDGDV